MEYNKKGIIILASVSIIAAILGIISTILIINYKRNTNTTETSTLSEFREEDKNDNNIDNNVEEEKEDENNIENEIEQEENKKDTSSQNNNTKPNTTTPTNNENYYIKVNLQANVVTIYKKDEEGKFTVPVKAMVCSTGTATPTSGVYSTTNKYEWRLLIGNVYGQYATRIVGSILFHSVPYTKKDPSALEYWEYDKLGTKASAGCIRLTVKDAKWIYDNCKSGTKVEFYSDSNPGPLGKPTAQKISNADENIRIWDPTDPKSNNPWKTYNPNKEENEPIEDNKENKTENTKTDEENTTNNTTTENKPVKDENNNTQIENKTEENTTNGTQTENKTEENITNETQIENKIEINTTNNTQKENIQNIVTSEA